MPDQHSHQSTTAAVLQDDPITSTFRSTRPPSPTELPEPDVLMGPPNGAVATIKELECTRAIVEAEHLEDGDDACSLPESAAWERVAGLICESARHLGERYPVGEASVDVNGTIHVGWQQGNRQVLLQVVSDRRLRDHVYWRDSGESSLEWEPRATVIAQRLAWLLHA